MRFTVNDVVYCKIKGNTIVATAELNSDIQLPFTIIGTDKKSKYLLLIPKYYSIKNSWVIQDQHLEKFDLSIIHLDQKAITIGEDRVCRVVLHTSHLDGLYCNTCKEFYPMAEANQKDGTLKCYGCRN